MPTQLRLPSNRALRQYVRASDHAAGQHRPSERRIGHQRHVVLLAPWQQVMFDAAVAEVIRDLIGRAAIAMWNMKQRLPCG